MKTRNTIIWLLVLFVLGAFVYFYEIIGGKERQQEKMAEKQIFNLPLEQVTGVEVLTKTGKVRCTLSDKGIWEIVEPIKTNADYTALKEIILGIVDAKIQRVVDENPQDLDLYGLKNAPFKVTIISEKEEYPLLLGELNPTGAFVYAKREKDNKVFLLFSNLRKTMDKDLFALRNKRLFELQENKISHLSIEHAQEKILLTKDPAANNWQIVEPVNAPADNEETGNIIYILNGMHVKSFVAEQATDLAQYGLEKPKAVIEVTLDDDSHHTLLLGNIDDAKGVLYAKRKNRGTIFALPEESGEYLTRNVFELREKKLLSLAPTDILQIELIDNKQHLLLKRTPDNNNWQMLKPETGLAQTTLVDGILDSLTKLRAKKFIDKPKQKGDYGFKKPTLTVNLWVNEAKSNSYSLILGAKKAQTEWIYIKINDIIALVDATAIEKINQPASELKRTN